jgi:CheY-like chemotaxis protein
MTKTSVLLVDDDQPVRETLAEALALDGYDVTSVENGQRALHVLAKARPDVIVLDLMMPAMDGWEFRRLQREIHGDIPVIAISAASDPRLDELRPDAYLMKPFDLDTFLLVLRGVLRRNGTELAS